MLRQGRQFWGQFFPQAKWILHHPKRLLTASAGALLVTFAYVGAVAACIAAFGQTPHLLSVAAAYLLANTLGAMIPTPGAVGSVEATLVIFLAAIGVPTAVAVSASLTFRITTFYVLIPPGYITLQYMQHRGIL